MPFLNITPRLYRPLLPLCSAVQSRLYVFGQVIGTNIVNGAISNHFVRDESEVLFAKVAQDRLAQSHGLDGKAPVPTRENLVDDKICALIDRHRFGMGHALDEYQFEFIFTFQRFKGL